MRDELVEEFFGEIDAFYATLRERIRVLNPMYEIVLHEVSGTAYLTTTFRHVRRYRDFFLRRKIEAFFKRLMFRIHRGEFGFYQGDVCLETGYSQVSTTTVVCTYKAIGQYRVVLHFLDGMSFAGFPPSSAWVLRRMVGVKAKDIL